MDYKFVLFFLLLGALPLFLFNKFLMVRVKPRENLLRFFVYALLFVSVTVGLTTVLVAIYIKYLIPKA